MRHPIPTAADAAFISVNGEQIETPPGLNIQSLLEFLKITPDRVAVELNKTLVRRRDWNTTEITPGVLIEVVEFVGGG